MTDGVAPNNSRQCSMEDTAIETCRASKILAQFLKGADVPEWPPRCRMEWGLTCQALAEGKIGIEQGWEAAFLHQADKPGALRSRQ